MSNLVYDKITTENFEETYFSFYFIVSMQETNKNCHTNRLELQEIAARQNVIRTHYIIKPFLNYFEYAILSLRNLLVY